MKKLFYLGAVWVTVLCLLAGCFCAPYSAPNTGEVEQTTEPGPTVPPNPYGPEDFGYDGDYLTCLSGSSRLGIDVSYCQPEIDWQQVADAGVEFVMIRLGWRGSEQGMIFEDEYVRQHYEGAKAAGLAVGGYFFSQAINNQEAAEEAMFVVDMIRDWEMDMPIVFDWEYIDENARTANMDARTLTDCTRTFCEVIRQAGYQPMIYFNWYQGRDLLYLEELTEFDFWLAMYGTEMDYPYQVDMWQYSCTGSVPGIPVDVDLNLALYYE